VLLRTLPEDVTVQIKSMSSLTPPPSKLDLTAEVDASKITEGTTAVRVTLSDIAVPSGMIISSVSPSSIRITAERVLRKNVPVRAALKGRLPSGATQSSVICEPDSVSIEGPASRISQITSVATEEIDASQLKLGEEYLKNLHVPGKLVSILRDTPVTVKLIARDRRKR
jgi:YbbR domain-containing protein